MRKICSNASIGEISLDWFKSFELFHDFSYLKRRIDGGEIYFGSTCHYFKRMQTDSNEFWLAAWFSYFLNRFIKIVQVWTLDLVSRLLVLLNEFDASFWFQVEQQNLRNLQIVMVFEPTRHFRIWLPSHTYEFGHYIFFFFFKERNSSFWLWVFEANQIICVIWWHVTNNKQNNNAIRLY